MKKIFFVCVLCLLLVGCGGRSDGRQDATPTSVVSPTHSTVVETPTKLSATPTATHGVTQIVALLHVNAVSITVDPATLSIWACGDYIQVIYHAFFSVIPGNGGVIQFEYTLNNGRSSTPEKLTILPGQTKTDFVFTWQGQLNADHVYPGLGNVHVISPNDVLATARGPAGECR